jgi:hypothetical protein
MSERITPTTLREMALMDPHGAVYLHHSWLLRLAEQMEADRIDYQNLLNKASDALFERDEALAKVAVLTKLVQAVKCSEFNGLSCDDVDGKNWFDVRDEVRNEPS